MPKLNFTIPGDLLDRIDAAKPNYLDRKGFLCLLLEQQLDRGGTLGGPSEAGTPSNTLLEVSSNTSKTIYKAINEAQNEAITVPKARSAKARKPKAQGTPEFEAFWRAYQAIKRRASNQSKPRALEAWADVAASVAPEALQGALNRAIAQQARQERDGGFASPFPDCFRWLRDGYYEAFLDNSTPAVVIPKLPDFTPPPEFPDAPF